MGNCEKKQENERPIIERSMTTHLEVSFPVGRIRSESERYKDQKTES